MITALEYLVIAAAIGAAVFVVVFVFGRGEQMAPLNPRTSPAELPDADIGGDDVRRVKFAMALRGYRMSDVDWVLDRVGERLDELQRDNVRLRGNDVDPMTATGEGAPGELFHVTDQEPTAGAPQAADQMAAVSSVGQAPHAGTGDQR